VPAGREKVGAGWGKTGERELKTGWSKRKYNGTRWEKRGKWLRDWGKRKKAEKNGG